jgi:hypothetical protein
VSSFQRPEILSFEPTTGPPVAANGGFVHDTMTLDARNGDEWTFYSFERGTVVDGTVDPEWDIAIQRFHLVTNGGPGYPGDGGALAVPAEFDAVREAPADGYSVTEGRLADAPVNPALERWYTYSFFAHTLEPKPETYVIRTAEGRFAKLRVISYYCPEAVPGCFTFRYSYQGAGGRELDDGAP